MLMAVATLGGRGSYPSNRMVADEAGITDQGQISKLLRRLESLGLIEIAGKTPAKGSPNAWKLTEKGRGLYDAIGERTSGDSPWREGSSAATTAMSSGHGAER